MTYEGHGYLSRELISEALINSANSEKNAVSMLTD